jgi:gas vesicle protein
MSNKNLLMSFITGAATGAVLGILFAPASGKETRKKIVKAKQHSAEYLEELVEEGKKSWYKTKGKVESGAGVAANELNDFISHILRTGESWWKKSKNRTSKLVDETENTLGEIAQDSKKSANQVVKEGRSTVNEIQNHFS